MEKQISMTCLGVRFFCYRNPPHIWVNRQSRWKRKHTTMQLIQLTWWTRSFFLSLRLPSIQDPIQYKEKLDTEAIYSKTKSSRVQAEKPLGNSHWLYWSEQTVVKGPTSSLRLLHMIFALSVVVLYSKTWFTKLPVAASVVTHKQSWVFTHDEENNNKTRAGKRNFMESVWAKVSVSLKQLTNATFIPDKMSNFP